VERFVSRERFHVAAHLDHGVRLGVPQNRFMREGKAGSATFDVKVFRLKVLRRDAKCGVNDVLCHVRRRERCAEFERRVHQSIDGGVLHLPECLDSQLRVFGRAGPSQIVPRDLQTPQLITRRQEIPRGKVASKETQVLWSRGSCISDGLEERYFQRVEFPSRKCENGPRGALVVDAKGRQAFRPGGNGKGVSVLIRHIVELCAPLHARLPGAQPVKDLEGPSAIAVRFAVIGRGCGRSLLLRGSGGRWLLAHEQRTGKTQQPRRDDRPHSFPIL
jgi:hypothetical protein